MSDVMTESEQGTRRRCSECGVSIPPAAGRCWLCGRSAALAHLPAAAAARRRFPLATFRFQLHSVFLTTALLAACLAVARPFPSLAMALVVPLATAYLRTLQIALEFGAVARPFGALAKIWLFAKSFGVALVILLGACSTLIVAIGLGAGLGILVGQWRDEPTYVLIGFGAGTSLGVFAALAVAAWTGQRFWPGPRAVHEGTE